MWGWIPDVHEEFLCLPEEEHCTVLSIYNIQVISAPVLHNLRVWFYILGIKTCRDRQLQKLVARDGTSRNI